MDLTEGWVFIPGLVVLFALGAVVEGRLKQSTGIAVTPPSRRPSGYGL